MEISFVHPRAYGIFDIVVDRAEAGEDSEKYKRTIPTVVQLH